MVSEGAALQNPFVINYHKLYYYPPVCRMMSNKKCWLERERERERERESMNTAVFNAHRYYYLSFRIRLAADQSCKLDGFFLANEIACNKVNKQIIQYKWFLAHRIEMDRRLIINIHRVQ